MGRGGDLCLADMSANIHFWKTYTSSTTSKQYRGDPGQWSILGVGQSRR